MIAHASATNLYGMIENGYGFTQWRERSSQLELRYFLSLEWEYYMFLPKKWRANKNFYISPSTSLQQWKVLFLRKHWNRRIPAVALVYGSSRPRKPPRLPGSPYMANGSIMLSDSTSACMGKENQALAARPTGPRTCASLTQENRTRSLVWVLLRGAGRRSTCVHGSGRRAARVLNSYSIPRVWNSGVLYIYILFVALSVRTLLFTALIRLFMPKPFFAVWRLVCSGC